jgi:hypothetical protein
MLALNLSRQAANPDIEGVPLGPRRALVHNAREEAQPGDIRAGKRGLGGHRGGEDHGEHV